MTAIKAELRDGRFVPLEPHDWPDGSIVDIARRDTEDSDIFGDSPEAIARWIALAESIPAPTMSDEEWEAWQQRRCEDRAWELANVAAREKALLASVE